MEVKSERNLDDGNFFATRFLTKLVKLGRCDSLGDILGQTNWYLSEGGFD